MLQPRQSDANRLVLQTTLRVVMMLIALGAVLWTGLSLRQNPDQSWLQVLTDPGAQPAAVVKPPLTTPSQSQ